MSIQQRFGKKLADGLTILIAGLDSNTANELEFRLGQYDNKKHFHPGQSMLQFKTIIENLQRMDLEFSEESTLDVSIHNASSGELKNVRMSISQLNNIRKFCLNEKVENIDTKCISYIRKTKLVTHDYVDYQFRGQLSNEEKITDTELIDQFNTEIGKQSTVKYYRYKHRYTFKPKDIGQDYRFDLTLTKAGVGNTFKKSGTLGKKETYEVEIEFTGDQLDNTANAEHLAKLFTSSIYDVLKWSQDSFAIVTTSETEAVEAEYIEMFFPDELSALSKISDVRQTFVGMDVLPLEVDHIISDTNDNFLIKNGYSVTEKADGDRYLLIISNADQYQGNIYLRNNRGQLKHTGLQATNPLLYGSVFDCEVVRLKESNAFKCLIFDCLHWNGKDIRDLPLIEDGDKLEDLSDITSRYRAVQSLVKQYSATSLATGIKLEIADKRYMFKFTDSPATIFQLSDAVYQPEDYNYELDGLIFTPFSVPYPKASLTKQVKWSELLKWKPLNQLSVDFMVEIVKKDGSETIKTDFDSSSTEGWTYKTAHLKVLKAYKTKSGWVKKFIDFVPSKYVVPDLHVIKLKLDKDNQIRTLDNNIIYNGSVVEFIYDDEQAAGYKWIPIRFRADKTENQAPNGYRTADSTWSLIKNPVKLSMITGQEKVDATSKSAQQQYYTQNSQALIKLTQPMKNYHNRIKELLITEVASKLTGKLSLLDTSVGRAGDLAKWGKAKISYVLGIDYDELNLTNENDGAIERYRNLKLSGKYHYPKKVEFIWGDATQPMNTGKAGMDSINREMLRNTLSLRGIESFDIVSTQFAIHYFMHDEQAIRTYFSNVATNLKMGGYLVGTTLDGQQVFSELSTLNKGENISGTKKMFEIWKITKCYDQSKLEDLGQKIKVYNVSIGADIEEWLVNFQFLTDLAKEYGLELVDSSEFEELDGLQSFGDIYDTVLSKYTYAKESIESMSESERQYSFMNSYFIFKKVGSSTVKATVEEAVTPSTDTDESVKIPIMLKKPIGLKKKSSGSSTGDGDGSGGSD
jgi:mRNA (guanine-N7-)-methyltransferase